MSPSPLKIYPLSDYKEAAPWILYPFTPPKDPIEYTHYVHSGRELVTIANSPEQADCLLDFDPRKNTPSPDTGTPTIAFLFNDEEGPCNLDNITALFRTSLRKSLQKPNELALPGFCHDHLKDHYGGKLKLREQGNTPTVAFCGDAFSRKDAPLLLQPLNWLYTKLRFAAISHIPTFKCLSKLGFRPTKRPGTYLRMQSLRALEKHPKIQTNFIFRQSFFDGTAHGSDQRHRKRKEFLENITGADYVVCARGQGNFSIRFYETLAMGRIPIFINSDCVLPFEGIIEWKKYVVWVEEDELGQIGQKVLDFHNKLSAEAFTQLQKDCRKLWEEYLSPEGFVKHLKSILPKTP